MVEPPMTLESKTPEELAAILGEHLRRSRVLRRMTQAELAAKAQISERSVSVLECGSGSTVETMLRVIKALDHLEIVDAFAPLPSVDPFLHLRGRVPQYRRVRKRQGESK
jgi:transcriptional regulator with XRE-family HTH domain